MNSMAAVIFAITAWVLIKSKMFLIEVEASLLTLLFDSHTFLIINPLVLTINFD